MPAKKHSPPSPEAVHAAERTFNEALVHAKKLKAQSRDAKRKLKQAKKAARKASKAARVARKKAAKLRHLYEKAAGRAKTPGRRSESARGPKRVGRRRKAKEPAPIRTKKIPARSTPPAPQPEPTPAPSAGGVDFDVAFSAADLESIGAN